MKRKGVLVLGVFLTASILGMVAADYTVYVVLQKQLEVEVKGTWVPNLWAPGFEVKQASFSWEDKFRVHSGDIRVRYHPLSWLKGNGLRFQVSSEQLDAELFSGMAEDAGLQRAVFDRFYADVRLSGKKFNQIYSLEAISPVFKFRFGVAERRAGDQNPVEKRP